MQGQQQIPFGNDRQKSKSNGKNKGKSRGNGSGKGKSGSFALLRMTTFVAVRAVGSCLDRASYDFGPPKTQKQERAVGGAPSFIPGARKRRWQT